MANNRRAIHRSAALLAACLVAAGSVLLVTGEASAAPASKSRVPKALSAEGSTAKVTQASPAQNRLVIQWWADSVTLTLPARCTTVACQYMLWVDEPTTPGTPVVGYATGTSGTLTVAYPTDFCGVLQADALRGPPPWRAIVGHQRTVEIGDCGSTTTTSSSTSTTTTIPTSPSTSTTSTSTSTSTTVPTSPSSSTTSTSTSTTVPSAPGGSTSTTSTTVKSSLPFTGGTDPTGSSGGSKPTAASLPFTGANMTPLAFLGMLLILAGLLILTTLEQRRRALRRLSTAVTATSLRERAGSSARWFLGE